MQTVNYDLILTGSERKVLVNNNLKWPNGLAVHRSAKVSVSESPEFRPYVFITITFPHTHTYIHAQYTHTHTHTHTHMYN